MYEQLQSLDKLSINFNAAGVQILNIVLAVVMFGVALGVKTDTFRAVIKNPKSLIVGLLLQWIALPAITFLIIILLGENITPMVAMGMLLVASCPGGNISNFMSDYAKGNTELSVSMTAVSTCFSAFITPINFGLWNRFYLNFATSRQGMERIPELVIEFWPMFQQVIILLGIPIVAGMLFARYLPKQTGKINKPLQILSLLFFVAMVVIAFSQNLRLFIDHIGWIFLIVLIHNILALSIGYFGSSLVGLPKKDRRSLTIEVGVQNSGLGLVLLFNPHIFPQDGVGGMLFVTAWWGVWHIVAGLTTASWFRFKSKED